MCKTALFSAAERPVYEALRRLTPKHTVFAKVCLAELVSVSDRITDRFEVGRIDAKHIDFVLCDDNFAPIVVIQLDEHTSARDALVDEVLAAASLPVIHIRTGRRYGMDELHQLLLPYLRIGTATL